MTAGLIKKRNIEPIYQGQARPTSMRDKNGNFDRFFLILIMVNPTKYFGCTWGWPNLTVYGLGGTEGGVEPLLVDHFSLLLGGITTEKMLQSLIT